MSDEDRLRRAYQGWITTRVPSERPACPSPEALRDAATREGAEAARLTVLEHVTRCAACRAEFALVESAAAPGRRRLAWARVAAAAAAVVLAVGGVMMWRSSVPTAPPLRTGPAEVRLLPPERTAGDGTTLTFRWHAVTGARGYALELLTPAGAVLRTATTPDTALVLSLPESGDGKELRWWVRALLPEGELTSPVTALRPRP